MEDFETAVTNFARFLVQQGFPPNVLWLTPDDIVFWQLRYHFWKGDPGQRRERAKVEYEHGVARNFGIALQAECKTERWSICRVYLPTEEIDAGCRMIPRTFVKMSAVTDPKPAKEIENRIQWRILRWWTRRNRPCWE